MLWSWSPYFTLGVGTEYDGAWAIPWSFPLRRIGTVKPFVSGSHFGRQQQIGAYSRAWSLLCMFYDVIQRQQTAEALSLSVSSSWNTTGQSNRTSDVTLYHMYNKSTVSLACSFTSICSCLLWCQTFGCIYFATKSSIWLKKQHIVMNKPCGLLHETNKTLTKDRGVVNSCLIDGIFVLRWYLLPCNVCCTLPSAQLDAHDSV